MCLLKIMLKILWFVALISIVNGDTSTMKSTEYTGTTTAFTSIAPTTTEDSKSTVQAYVDPPNYSEIICPNILIDSVMIKGNILLANFLTEIAQVKL